MASLSSTRVSFSNEGFLLGEQEQDSNLALTELDKGKRLFQF
jgi:hypothetical protein